MKTEKLFCERGSHSWTREVKKGRKPRNCDDCSQYVDTSSTIVVDEEDDAYVFKLSVKLTGFCNMEQHHLCDGLIIAGPTNKIPGWRCPCACHGWKDAE